jgi:alpha-glucosidase
LRYKLLPFLYSLFHEHAETGAPIMRPLWFEYPSDVRTYLIEDQYLVGRDLLVAPVVQEGEVKRRVYFPRGDAWVDWWTGKRYEGGKEEEIDAPIDRLPLFARVGAAIPTQPVIQHTDEMARVPLSITVVPGTNNASSFYTDAGDSYDYQRGAFRTLTISQNMWKLRLTQAGSYSNSRPLAALEMESLLDLVKCVSVAE